MQKYTITITENKLSGVKKKTYYRSIYDQKEINRFIMSLQGATLPLKQDLTKLCQVEIHL